MARYAPATLAATMLLWPAVPALRHPPMPAKRPRPSSRRFRLLLVPRAARWHPCRCPQPREQGDLFSFVRDQLTIDKGL
jgi:hypothetical protein